MMTGTYVRGLEEIEVLWDDAILGRYKLILLALPYGKVVLDQSEEEAAEYLKDYEWVGSRT